ncbi:PLP-dependent transferase [Pseudovirgaria hyperparasitica]|uniref:PLP-dependent transferase n=1 Tax=Pseudovirgaria hyperparasitica TaxID=470096 RepID=A0A6A6W232_9PEZI|nr:PLP-dependent transferase [Pseudovirgaria hyperparasitica]KAF2756952.1 PLP-dependent transferase [Pseudovirgaria hyperparasitica]
MSPALINDGNVVVSPTTTNGHDSKNGPTVQKRSLIDHDEHSSEPDAKRLLTDKQNGSKNGHSVKDKLSNGHAETESPEPAKPSAVLHRSLHEDPITVIRASGNYLYTSNGQKILDATGGAAVSCLGHGDERIKQAINAQLDEVAYCHSLFFGTNGGEALAHELIEGTNGEMAKAFIVSSGSEAMEAAMKMARQYFLELSPPQPNRTRFIARKQSYHGTTLGALSLGGHVARRALYEPLLGTNISHVSECNVYRGMRDGEDEVAYVKRLAKELDEEFQRVGPGNVCAFVAEPVVGAALGCVPAPALYFPLIFQICRTHGALLILDEIMCGMGRTGTLHAWQHPSIATTPDIQTIGKSLAGGYQPIAALLLSHRVVDTLRSGSASFSHGQTYQAHPVACAAAAAVQRVVRAEHLVANVARMGDLLGRGLRARLGAHPHVGDIRGRGLFWGIEFVADKEGKRAFRPEVGVARRVHELGMREGFGISLYPGTGCVDGVRGDHVLVCPAFNVDEGVVGEIVEGVGRVVEGFFGGLEGEFGGGGGGGE